MGSDLDEVGGSMIDGSQGQGIPNRFKQGIVLRFGNGLGGVNKSMDKVQATQAVCVYGHGHVNRVE